MDNQTLDKTLQACNYDIDLTIEKLQQLSLASSQNPNNHHAKNNNVLGEKDLKWVDMLVQEMTCATSIDDAKARAARALAARERDQAVTADQKNVRLSQENSVLRRLLVLQHERLKGYEESKQEVEILKGMLSKCKEELKKCEFNNYTLRVHLDNRPKSSLINTSNLPPDVY
ncbi:hypothetical protein RND81_04G201400 [Saponaria officinalis]|uniref:Uncharacterized protein n=1 Tax=Saponaria officinalis TaxID=3572 RepID=A0AAW1LLH1_SAPOF